MNLTKRWPLLLAAGLLLPTMVGFGSGCGTGRGELYPALAQPLYWPQPPDRPRIQYLGQFRSEDDLKREVSSMESLGRLIFGRQPIGVFARPFAICKANEVLYVADSSGSVIHRMDLQTRHYRQFSRLDGDRRLKSPIAMAVAGGRLYVADSLLAEICVFDLEGNYRFSFGTDRLRRPSGLAVSPRQGKVYAADTMLHAVSSFDLDGHYLGQLGEQGEARRRFNYPTALWVDHDDKLYVSDTLNYRVQVFDPQGQFLSVIGRHGDSPGCFAHPSGLATDSHGNLYVSDKQFENVQIFNPQGRILMAFGNEGNAPGEFWLPAGIFIDENDRIYVADAFNQRIQVFQLLEGQEP